MQFCICSFKAKQFSKTIVLYNSQFNFHTKIDGVIIVFFLISEQFERTILEIKGVIQNQFQTYFFFFFIFWRRVCKLAKFNPFNVSIQRPLTTYNLFFFFCNFYITIINNYDAHITVLLRVCAILIFICN